MLVPGPGGRARHDPGLDARALGGQVCGCTVRFPHPLAAVVPVPPGARGYRVRVSNPAGEDPATSFRRAERRLRDVLLGDGTYSAGTVKGEEARAKVAIELRHMREAFEAQLAAADAARAERAEARVADLEEELRRRAAAGSRRRPTKKKA